MIAGLEVLQSAVEVGTKSPQNVRKYGGPDVSNCQICIDVSSYLFTFRQNMNQVTQNVSWMACLITKES